MRSRPAFLRLLFALSAVAASAHGEPSPVDRATAQQLFDDGKKLVTEGKLADACPRFAESNRLDPALGTQLRLADCFEKNGQVASAWATFLDAADLAGKSKDPREKIARERASSLARRIPKLVVRVTDPSMAGLEVRRDGEVLRSALWGTEAPVDPGPHVIEATAPGHEMWRVSMTVSADARSIEVVVPSLAPVSAPVATPPASSSSTLRPPPPPETPPPPRPAPSSTPVLGYVLGGAGIVSGVLGAVLFLEGKSKHTTAVGECQSGVDSAGPYNHCGGDAQSADKSAHTLGAVGDVFMGVGGALLVTGIVLVATRPSPSATSVRIAPTVGSHRGGLALGGAW